MELKPEEAIKIAEKVIKKVQTIFKAIFTKESISYCAEIAVIIAFTFGVISWSMEYKLSYDTLKEQEKENNMPPTMLLIQNIAGTSENFSLNPCIFVKKNSNRHFIVIYLSTKIGREINKSFPSIKYLITRPEDYPSKRFFDDQYMTASESIGSFLNNNISELENGKICLEESYYGMNFDYNPIIDNYAMYNSSNKDMNIEYNIEIEDMDSEISYIGVIKTKIKGNTVYPIDHQIYRPLKFNWINIGIQNSYEFASPIEQDILFNRLYQRTIFNKK